MDPNSKEDKVKVTNFNNLPKIQILWILKQTLHATHLLMLLDKMWNRSEKYYWRYRADTILSTDEPTDRRTMWNQYTPFQLCWSGGYDYDHSEITVIFPKGQGVDHRTKLLAVAFLTQPNDIMLVKSPNNSRIVQLRLHNSPGDGLL